jgi:autotransporter-associated beta strand protein
VTDGTTSGEGTYRNVGSPDPLDEFSYGEVAAINTGNFLLRGGEVQTWKNGTGNVTGAKLHYRVYYQNDGPSGSFSELNLAFNANLPPTGSGDQRWKTTNHNVNLLSGQTRSGVYVIEYYFRITTNCSDDLLSNSGGNYQTYVTAFYEINTASTVTQNTTGGASVVGGSGKFVKKGSGTVQINNANSGYTGNTFIDQGTLSIQAAAGLGSGYLRVGPGTGSATGW